MPTFSDRLQHAWNAFKNNKYETGPTYVNMGIGNSIRPDRTQLRITTERSIVAPIFNRIAIDVSQCDIRHVRLDENGRYKEPIEDDLDYIFTDRANIDQTGREFVRDMVMSIDTYQKSIYKSNGANLLIDNCYIHISGEFYTSDLDQAIIFYGENSNDYNYSLLSNLFLLCGSGISAKFSNVTPFTVPLINCRIEPPIDISMLLSHTGLSQNPYPFEAMESDVVLNAQTSWENLYVRYIDFDITVDTLFFFES